MKRKLMLAVALASLTEACGEGMPTARSFASGAVAAGKLYLIGGATSPSRASKVVEAYTP